jgi:hypothetical protein
MELPDDLAQDLEQELTRSHLSLAEFLRETLLMWKAHQAASASEREQVIRVLQEKGLLCQLPSDLVAHGQPLTAEELERLAMQAAQGGPLSELILRERHGAD